MKKEKEKNNFYCFREIIKADLYKSSLDQLVGSIFLLHQILTNESKLPKSEVNKEWCKGFEKLVMLAKEIIDKRCEKQPDHLYGYGEQVEFDEAMIAKVQRITIARIACFLVDQQNYLKDKPDMLDGLLRSYVGAMQVLGFYGLNDEYTTTQFIHSSRGLLDTENPETATYLMGKVLEKVIVIKYELTDEERKIFSEVKAFWEDTVIGSVSFDQAIQRFIDNYPLKEEEVTVDKIRDLCKRMKIDFVMSRSYYGMVGFNGVILTTLVFKELYVDEKNVELTKRLILTTIIHECANYILRVVKEDFGFLTPRNGYDDEKRQRLEAGYLMEDILFGDAWIEGSSYELLMNPEVWGRGIPIIQDGELTLSSKRDKRDNLCTFGFLLTETKKKCL
jgi:hypothetical protein